MSRLELVWWVLVWAHGAVALLRWPGRTVGLVAAVVAWTAVGPWASCATLAATIAGAVGWRMSTRRRGRGLIARPRWAACVLSAAATVLAPGWWVAPALVALVASTGWLMATEFGRPTAAGRSALARRVRRVAAPAGDAVVEQTEVLVAEIEDFLRTDGGAARGPA